MKQQRQLEELRIANDTTIRELEQLQNEKRITLVNFFLMFVNFNNFFFNYR